MTDYTKLEKEVDAAADTIWDVAFKVWQFAELSYKEIQSSPYVAGTLKKSGFSIRDKGIVGLDTSWVATWGSGSPVSGILIEFDALPGLDNDTVPEHAPAKSGNPNGHGCGHNLITGPEKNSAVIMKDGKIYKNTIK